MPTLLCSLASSPSVVSASVAAALSANAFRTIVDIDTVGTFLVTRECYRQWMEANGGNIVNIVADYHFGMPIMGHTGAARAGMVNFTETAAVEWAVSGVRVNAVAPGWIASSGFDTYDEKMQAELKALWRHVPLKRHGTESEVSAAIVFLLSEAACFINGSTIRVDGGAPNAKLNYEMPDHKNSKMYQGFHLYELPKMMQE